MYSGMPPKMLLPALSLVLHAIYLPRFVVTIEMFLPNVKMAAELCGGIEKIVVIGMEKTPPECARCRHLHLRHGFRHDLESTIRGADTLHNRLDTIDRLKTGDC